MMSAQGPLTWSLGAMNRHSGTRAAGNASALVRLGTIVLSVPPLTYALLPVNGFVDNMMVLGCVLLALMLVGSGWVLSALARNAGGWTQMHGALFLAVPVAVVALVTGACLATLLGYCYATKCTWA